MTRNVKFGRKPLPGGPIAYHWAVGVGRDWYEVAGVSKGNKGNAISVARDSHCSNQGAGALGGELVGEVCGRLSNSCPDAPTAAATVPDQTPKLPDIYFENSSTFAMPPEA